MGSSQIRTLCLKCCVWISVCVWEYSHYPSFQQMITVKRKWEKGRGRKRRGKRGRGEREKDQKRERGERKKENCGNKGREEREGRSYSGMGERHRWVSRLCKYAGLILITLGKVKLCWCNMGIIAALWIPNSTLQLYGCLGHHKCQLWVVKISWKWHP